MTNSDALMPRERPATEQPQIIAVTGGKGGVGKTSVALNLSLTLSREGSRVLLLDGDTDLANVSIMLGQYPDKTLEQVLNGECSLASVLMETEFGLHVVPGASGVQACMDMGADESLGLLRQLALLERNYDYLVIDTASGLQPVVLHMIAAAAMACVVVTPEPTSLTDAFSLLKVLQRRGYQRTPSVLVNMARGASQAQSVFRRFSGAVQRHLGMTPHYLGAVWRDETIRQSVTNQRPVAMMPESDPSSRQFRVLADMVRVRLEQLPPRRVGLAAYWHGVAERARARRQEEDDRDTTPQNSGESLVTALAAEARAGCTDSVTPPVETADRQVHRLVTELDRALSSPEAGSMLRYEAFTACFALLGRSMDEDAVEIIQTGLAALEWESLPPEQGLQFARHLQLLADQMRTVHEARHASPASRVTPPECPENDLAGPAQPRYDRARFGDQEKLLRALQAQPGDVPLSHVLRALTSASDDER